MASTSTTTADARALARALELPWPEEWWERLRDRRHAWARRHVVWLRRLLVARLVVLGTSLPWLVVTGSSSIWVRESMIAVYAGSLWVCVLWFLALRTRTVALVGVVRWFAASVVWSLLAGWVLFRLAHTDGLSPSRTGAMTMIAALGEESLKILPLAVLALVAPGRTRRFAAADWMLLGVTSGAGFLCAEEVLKRFVLRERWGDASSVVGGAAEFGLSGVTSTADYATFFPGHHVTTALVAASVGLAVALWRAVGDRDDAWRTAGRLTAVLMPLCTWWSAVSVHAHVNLLGQDVALLPGLVRWWLPVLPDAWGTGPTVVLATTVVLLVDAARLRRAGAGPVPVPVHPVALRLDLELSRLAPPGDPAARKAAAGATSLARSAVFLVADSLRTVHTFVAAGARQPGERWWVAARRAQASLVVVRRSREVLLAEAAGPGARGRDRAVAAAVVVGLLVAALPLARALAGHVETRRDHSLGITWSIAGVLMRLDAWWDGLSGWEKVAVLGAAFALTALAAGTLTSATIGGSLMAGVSTASGAFSFVDNADHLADRVRDPGTAAQKYWDDATPASVLLDVGTLALTFWAPSRLAAPVRHAIDDELGVQGLRLDLRRLDTVLQPRGVVLGEAGTDPEIRVLTGGRAEADALFSRLRRHGTVVANNAKLLRVELRRGAGFVQLRTQMTRSHGTLVTIDVNIPSIPVEKVKFNP